MGTDGLHGLIRTERGDEGFQEFGFRRLLVAAALGEVLAPPTEPDPETVAAQERVTAVLSQILTSTGRLPVAVSEPDEPAPDPTGIRRSEVWGIVKATAAGMLIRKLPGYAPSASKNGEASTAVFRSTPMAGRQRSGPAARRAGIAQPAHLPLQLIALEETRT